MNEQHAIEETLNVFIFLIFAVAYIAIVIASIGCQWSRRLAIKQEAFIFFGIALSILVGGFNILLILLQAENETSIPRIFHWIAIFIGLIHILITTFIPFFRKKKRV